MNGLAETPAQAAQMQSAPSSSLVYKLKCIWLFLLGAVVAVIGLLCVIYRPDMGANSFIIMLMGLFFTAAGSIYGKRKLRGDIAVVPVGQQPVHAQFLQQLQELGVPVQQLVRQPSGNAASVSPVQQQPQPVQPQPAQFVQPQSPQPAEKPASEQKPAAQVARTEGKLLKIFVCPSCGAENEMDDRYCYRCGFNLEQVRTKARKTKGAGRKARARPKSSKEKPAAASKSARSEAKASAVRATKVAKPKTAADSA